jgi:hypothetical protein
MALSVVDPIEPSFRRVKRVLFAPFDLVKWLALGLTAFLAHLGQVSGGSFQFNTGGPSPGGGGGGGSAGPGGGPGPQIVQWIETHTGWVVLATVGLTLLGLAFSTLIFWLQGRGQFMFLDNVVRNRGLIAAPWRSYRSLGNSYLRFKLVMIVIGILITWAAVLIAAYLGWSDLKQQQLTTMGVWAIITLAVTLPLTWVTIFTIDVIAMDFLVPTMYLHALSAKPAWGKVYHELFRGHWGPITLFYLMRIVIGIAGGLIAIMATCATCCIAALPYVGSVVLLPVSVFTRCYSLFFIEQYGPAWRVFAVDPDHPRCPHCDYDLRGNPEATHCPECGVPNF